MSDSTDDRFVPCAADVTLPMRELFDQEGLTVPAGLPPVTDAHVHLFEPALFEAIWRWFATHGWPIRYKLHAADVVAFLKARGVAHIVALHYAHKPGMARAMNAAMARFVREGKGFVTGLATVLPGEPDAAAIVQEGFAQGLAGVKLHCHVQCFAADEGLADSVYDACEMNGMPLVMHAGREPKSVAYKVDTYAVCGANRTESVLRNFPKLKLCVPHLGADEFDAYERLLSKYDNLWLDTTMMLADYFPLHPEARLLRARPERIMYGTDFPNLPYAWDRELKRLSNYGIRDHDLPALLGGNAQTLFASAAIVP